MAVLSPFVVIFLPITRRSSAKLRSRRSFEGAEGSKSFWLKVMTQLQRKQEKNRQKWKKKHKNIKQKGCFLQN